MILYVCLGVACFIVGFVLGVILMAREAEDPYNDY
jgi:hypothetical protein